MSNLEAILRELFASEEQKTITLSRGLSLKFIPEKRRLIAARKGRFLHGGPQERRNWPSVQEEEIISQVLIKILPKTMEFITHHNLKAKDSDGTWWYSIQFQIKDVPQQATLLTVDEPPSNNYIRG